MNNTVGSGIARSVKEFYRRDESAKSIFDKLAQLQKDRASSGAERTAYMADVSYSEVIRVFRELEELGCGRFISGRKGKKTRIQWAYKIRSLAAAAKGEASTIDEIDENDLEIEADDFDADDLMVHSFQLRSDMTIELSLPRDLSTREAERLAAFVKSLPFE